MSVFHKAIQIKSETRPVFHDVTAYATAAVKESGIQNGMLLVYSQHTTCSIIVQEASDDRNYWGTELLHQDLLDVFERIIPTCRTEGQYHHPGPMHIDIAGRERQEKASWSLNTDAHLRSVLLGRSQSIPVIGGNTELGQFGRIYFVDFDQVRARERTVRMQIVGE